LSRAGDGRDGQTSRAQAFAAWILALEDGRLREAGA
jgi:hypothetical protein